MAISSRLRIRIFSVDTGTSIILAFWALGPIVLMFSLLRRQQLLDGGEKLDARIYSCHRRRVGDGDSRRQTVYELGIGYNYLGTEYRRGITVGRSAMNRHFPELTDFGDLPSLDSEGSYSLFKLVGSAFRSPHHLSNSLTVEEMRDEDLSNYKLPIAISRHNPRRAVLDVRRLEAIRGESL